MSKRKQLIEDLNINKARLSKKITGTFLTKASTIDDYLDGCEYIYVSLTKEQIQKLFTLKEELKKLESKDVLSINICDRMSIFIDKEHNEELELDKMEEVFDEPDDDNIIVIDYDWLSISPIADIDNYEMRLNDGYATVNEFGVYFIAYEKYSGFKFTSPAIRWEKLQELYEKMEE